MDASLENTGRHNPSGVLSTRERRRLGGRGFACGPRKFCPNFDSIRGYQRRAQRAEHVRLLGDR